MMVLMKQSVLTSYWQNCQWEDGTPISITNGHKQTERTLWVKK